MKFGLFGVLYDKGSLILHNELFTDPFNKELFPPNLKQLTTQGKYVSSNIKSIYDKGCC